MNLRGFKFNKDFYHLQFVKWRRKYIDIAINVSLLSFLVQKVENEQFHIVFKILAISRQNSYGLGRSLIGFKYCPSLGIQNFDLLFLQWEKMDVIKEKPLPESASGVVKEIQEG